MQTIPRLRSQLMKSFSELMKGRRVEPSIWTGGTMAARHVTTAAVRLFHISGIVCLFKDKLRARSIDSGVLFQHALCATDSEHTIRNDGGKARTSRRTRKSTVTATREWHGNKV